MQSNHRSMRLAARKVESKHVISHCPECGRWKTQSHELIETLTQEKDLLLVYWKKKMASSVYILLCDIMDNNSSFLNSCDLPWNRKCFIQFYFHVDISTISIADSSMSYIFSGMQIAYVRLTYYFGKYFFWVADNHAYSYMESLTWSSSLTFVDYEDFFQLPRCHLMECTTSLPTHSCVWSLFLNYDIS